VIEGQDYLDFRDAVLVHLVNDIEPPGIPRVQLSQIATEHGLAFPPSWILALARDYEQSGWGTVHLLNQVEYFEINGAGIARATELRRAQRRKGPLEYIRSVPRSDWIAAGAFIVSIFALFKG
jgi:hypothetical protein